MRKIYIPFLTVLLLGLLACNFVGLAAAENPAPVQPAAAVESAPAQNPPSSELCPPLAAPSGNTVTVSTEADLRQQATNAAPGTTILIEPGIYNLTDTIQLVAEGVTLRGSTGNRDDIILDGGGMLTWTFTQAIYIEADDVTVADLTIRNGDEHGISVQGSDRPLLYNLHIYDTGYQLVKVNPVGDGSDDGILACSRLEYTTTAPEDYTNGISAHNAHRWSVRDNQWFRIRTPGNVPAPTILFWSGSSDTIVERNTLVDCFQGIAFGNAAHESGDHFGGVVRNNFIYASQPHDSLIEMVHATGWLVANNTILLLNPYEGIAWGMEARFEDTTGTFANNLTNMPIWADRDGAQITESGNIIDAASEWFEEPAEGNLHLNADSLPPVDAATPLPEVERDIDGQSRPLGSAPDVGADEFSAVPAQPASAAAETAPPQDLPEDLIMPDDLVYIGAFRLPGGDEPPQTFAYGGNAMTYNPDSNSLFITGHERIAYGAVPDGGQVAEVSIPAPGLARNIEELNTAEFIQGFANIFEEHFVEFQEIPKIGLQYLNHPDTGPLLHTAWGEHLQRDEFPSHGWFSPNLSAPNFQGEWFIGNENMYSVNGYLFDIPAAWADAYTGGMLLATGRMRDGGQGGMGPTLFAYTPWNADGSPLPTGTRLDDVPLLLYENAYNTEDIYHAMNGYQHPDAWEGGAWLTSPGGKSAVLFAGTKSNGEKYWYGYVHPDGPQYACVDPRHNEDFTTCRMADGSPCPPEDFSGCCDEDAGTCPTGRGWWSTRFDAELILFDPNDLARVARGEMEPWEPQPYAVVDIDERLFFNPAEWDAVQLGTGDQRRERIGDVAYDRANGLLYVLELYGDGPKPLVHVWQVQP